MKPFAILFLLLLAASTKAQPIYRLKAVAMDDYKSTIFRPFDSATFSYTGNNPGSANWAWAEKLTPWAYNTWKMTPGLEWSEAKRYSYYFDTSSVKGIYKQVYNSNGDIESYTKNEYDAFSQTWKQTARHFLYDNNKLKEQYDGSARYRYHYTSTGMVDSIVKYGFTGGSPAWAFVGFVYYAYNTGGQLTEECQRNTGGSITWINYTYHTNGKILNEYIATYDDTGTFDYAYDTGDNLVSKLWREKKNAGLAFINKELDTLIYDVAGNIQERIHMRWNVDSNKWINYSKGNYTNNNLGLPATFDLQLWVKGAWIYDYDLNTPSLGSYRNRYYYELAWPVSVADNSNMQNLVLFPSPASGSISIHTSWQVAQPFVGVVYDMQGKVVKQWQEAAVKVYKHTIGLDGLPPGQYVLRLLGEREQASQQFTIIK